MNIKKIISWALVFSLILGVSSLTLAYSFDFGGKTVKIGWSMPDMTPLAARGELNWLEPDGRLLAHLRNVEEMFNCKIEFTPWAGWGNSLNYVLTEVLSGVPNLDVYFIESKELPSLVAEGVVYPIGEVLEKEYWDRIPLVARDPGLTKLFGRHY